MLLKRLVCIAACTAALCLAGCKAGEQQTTELPGEVRAMFFPEIEDFSVAQQHGVAAEQLSVDLGGFESCIGRFSLSAIADEMKNARLENGYYRLDEVPGTGLFCLASEDSLMLRSGQQVVFSHAAEPDGEEVARQISCTQGDSFYDYRTQPDGQGGYEMALSVRDSEGERSYRLTQDNALRRLEYDFSGGRDEVGGCEVMAEYYDETGAFVRMDCVWRDDVLGDTAYTAHAIDGLLAVEAGESALFLVDDAGTRYYSFHYAEDDPVFPVYFLREYDRLGAEPWRMFVFVRAGGAFPQVLVPLAQQE